jgi:hypothetical protein
MGKMQGKFKQTRWRTRFAYTRVPPSTKLQPASRLRADFPQAMIWYVSAKQGNDADDGQSLATAFKSISRAAEAATPGDTILIVPGAYDQDLPARVGAARAANIAVAVAGG